MKIPQHLLSLAPMLIACLSAGCGYLVPATYRAEVQFGSEVRDLVEQIGPVVVQGSLTLRDPAGDDGIRMTADRWVVELCTDSAGETWVRPSEVGFKPQVPRADFAGTYGTYVDGTVGQWVEWPEDEFLGGALNALVGGQESLCDDQFEFGAVVAPLGQQFLVDPSPTESQPPYECRQESEHQLRGRPIAIAEPLAFETTCENGYEDIVDVGPLSLVDALTDLPENYPEGAPRPDRLANAN